MEIKFKKVIAGSYEILVNGEFSGCVSKDEMGRWMASFNEMDLCTGWEVSRKAAVDHLIMMIQEEQQDIEKRKSAIAAADQCDLCGGSGRVGDDILCWKCEDPFLDDLAKDAEDDLNKLIRSDPGAPMIRDERTMVMTLKDIPAAESLQKALYEIKDGGEVRIKDPDLVDMVIHELSEMGIPFVKWAYDHEYTGILQKDEDDQEVI